MEKHKAVLTVTAAMPFYLEASIPISVRLEPCIIVTALKLSGK